MSRRSKPVLRANHVLRSNIVASHDIGVFNRSIPLHPRGQTSDHVRTRGNVAGGKHFGYIIYVRPEQYEQAVAALSI